ncbi:MAG: biliverdin-producing heme oxygenase [Dechloromonas sp.]|nr:MAG: biliverdin-producing heme oxygenase [Dechloromonas sp.]
MSRLATSESTGVSLSAREFLRRATHAEHVRLNQHPLLSGITRPGYPVGRYANVLVAYYHFYRVFESAIDESLTRLKHDFSYEDRRKLPWLAEDLDKLGIDPDSAAWTSSSRLAVPDALNASQVFGVLYTIEGSSLGGKVIAAHLAANLGLSASNGARFFTGYGEAVGTCWQTFAVRLESQLADSATRAQAGNAARLTFCTMEQVLDEQANHRPG